MESLEINYEITPDQINRIWFAYFKKGLPKLLAYGGAAAVLSLGLMLLSRQPLISALSFFVVISVPVILTLVNYQNYTRAARENFADLSAEELHVKMIFERGADGFDTY